jgi:exodeoxyribonuclease V alpha subunit
MSGEEQETLTGVLERIKFSGSDGFLVGELRNYRDLKLVPVVGKMLGAKVGDTFRLTGSFGVDPRFGKQFRALKARAAFPEDNTGTIRFLERLPFVGQSRAVRLVQAVGYQAILAILKDPSRQAEFAVLDPALSESKVKAIYRAFHEIIRSWGAQDELGVYGLSDEQVGRIVRRFGPDAVERVKADPFLLTELRGFGFPEADRIAAQMGHPIDGKVRVRGAILFALSEEELQGHTYADENELALKAARLLDVSWEPVIEVLHGMFGEDRALVVSSGEGRVHRKELHDAEREIAQWVMQGY